MARTRIINAQQHSSKYHSFSVTRAPNHRPPPHRDPQSVFVVVSHYRRRCAASEKRGRILSVRWRCTGTRDASCHTTQRAAVTVTRGRCAKRRRGRGRRWNSRSSAASECRADVATASERRAGGARIVSRGRARGGAAGRLVRDIGVRTVSLHPLLGTGRGLHGREEEMLGSCDG